MSFAPTSSSLVAMAERVYDAAVTSVAGLFGRREDMGFAPDHTLGVAQGIDPHFIPRAPMSNANIDVGLLVKLSREGYKRGKEITAQTHPELHHVWVEMCHRAGLKRVPQLIVADSKVPNAASLFNENAVVISTGLLTRLSFREAIAVFGHELGHESSDHSTPRAIAGYGFAFAGAYAGDKFAERGGIGSLIRYEKMGEGWFKQSLIKMFGDGTKPHGFWRSFANGIAGAYLATIPARQLTVHPTELDADRKGAMISGDPEGLVMALSKLEDMRHQKQGVWPAIKRGVAFVLSGYPSTDYRMGKLRAMAQTMPPGLTPAYQMTGQQVAAASQHPSVAPELAATPSAQINSVSAAERVEQVATPAIAGA